MNGIFKGSYLWRYLLIALCIHVTFFSLYTSIPTEPGIRKQELIWQWFTNDVIIESPKFVSNNNNILFDNHMYVWLLGAAITTKCVPPYACLTVGYLEETKLFINELPKYFNESECQFSYGTIKTLYGWWFYLLVIKVKLSKF